MRRVLRNFRSCRIKTCIFLSNSNNSCFFFSLPFSSFTNEKCHMTTTIRRNSSPSSNTPPPYQQQLPTAIGAPQNTNLNHITYNMSLDLFGDNNIGKEFDGIENVKRQEEGEGHNTGSLEEKQEDGGNSYTNVFEVKEKKEFCPMKLICTIGPQSESPQVLKGLMENGMSIARLNMSHGSHAEHEARIKTIRAIAEQIGVGHRVAVALDTKGPEIRTGSFRAKDKKKAEGVHVDAQRTVHEENEEKEPQGSDGLYLQTGAQVCLTADPKYKDNSSMDNFYIDYPPLVQVCSSIGSTILIADGSVQLRVIQQPRSEKHDDDPKQAKHLHCVVVSGGHLSGRNNVHLPGVTVELPALSDKDKQDIAFGVKAGIDMIFASFVQTAQDILDCQTLLKDLGAPHIALVAKVESKSGLHHLSEIIDASDGVMVARGDLGVEIDLEKVFLAQKKIISSCNAAAKPVICATQMLETMVRNQRPTRAEASDVANAVIDGADCLMLSGETAAGDHPVQAVKTLRKISIAGNHYIRHKKRFQDLISFAQPHFLSNKRYHLPAMSIGSCGVLSSLELDAKCILTTTISTNSVMLLRAFCPACPIVAVTYSLEAARRISLMKGVIPLYYPQWSERLSVEQWGNHFEEIIDTALKDITGPKAVLAKDGIFFRPVLVSSSQQTKDERKDNGSGEHIQKRGANASPQYIIVSCTDVVGDHPSCPALMRIVTVP